MSKKKKELENKVQELEQKVADLEGKKTFFKKFKGFALKYKSFFLVFLFLVVFLSAWEGYSLYSYRQGIFAATLAQREGDYEQAANNLLGVKKVTQRSFVLHFARKDNVEYMIDLNENWKRSNEKRVSEVKEDVKEKEKEKEETSVEKEYIQEEEPLFYSQPQVSNIDHEFNLETEDRFEWEKAFEKDKEPSEIPKVPEPPEFVPDEEIFQIDYLCSEEEFQKLKSERGTIMILITEIEGRQTIEKNACEREIDAKLRECIAACENQRTRVDAIYGCIDNCEREWVVGVCSYYFNDPGHIYNQQLSSFRKDLREIEGNLRVCLIERGY